MNKPVFIIFAREYLERVKRKSFILTTLLMPLLMLLLMAAPALIAAFSSPDEQTVAVIDDSGVIAPRLQNTGEITFRTVSGPLADVRSDDDYTAFLVIGPDVVAAPADNVSLYTRGASSMMVEGVITSQIENAVEALRIDRYDIANLRQIMKDVTVNITIPTYKLDESDDEADNATSSILSYGIGMLMMMMLYMFILLYGQMVMTSIIEEKNNRVLELVVSSVKPAWLMLGKLLGIGAVAVTQILIWVALIAAGSIWLVPFLSHAAADSDSVEMAQAVAQFTDSTFLGQLALYAVLFLIGGYFLYSSIFAMIGSAVDNIQDASQLQSLAVVPIIFALVVSVSVVQNPESDLAFWTSLIPFTSPMVMMARIPFGVPAWQGAVSLVLLYAGFVAMVWCAAKIYRVGIFMYGKKPTVKDLVRWFNYK